MVFIGIPFIYPFSFFSTYSKPPTNPYSGYSEGIYGFKIVSGRIISASNLQMIQILQDFGSSNHF
jgi:hypothetical protein